MSGKSDDRDPTERAEDPDRLLPGEDPRTAHAEDVEHWFSVYSELVQAKGVLLAAAADRLAQSREDDAKREFVSTDLEVITAEMRRLQGRLDFWKTRRAELEDRPGHDGDA